MNLARTSSDFILMILVSSHSIYKLIYWLGHFVFSATILPPRPNLVSSTWPSPLASFCFTVELSQNSSLYPWPLPSCLLLAAQSPVVLLPCLALLTLFFMGVRDSLVAGSQVFLSALPHLPAPQLWSLGSAFPAWTQPSSLFIVASGTHLRFPSCPRPPEPPRNATCCSPFLIGCTSFGCSHLWIWAELCHPRPPNTYICWSPKPSASKCGCIWRWGLWRGKSVKMRLLEWALFYLTSILRRRGDLSTSRATRDVCTWKKDHMRAKGDDGHLWARERGVRRNPSYQHLDLELPASSTEGK